MAKRGIWKSLLLSSTIVMSLAAHARQVAPEQYNFTAQNALEATVLSSKVVPPSDAKGKTLKIQVLDAKARAKATVRVRYFEAENSAQPEKLVFVLTGLGGNEATPAALYLAAHFQKNGLSAVVVPNSMTTEFIMGASRTGLVGDLVADAADTRALMSATLATLAKDGRNYTSNLIIGYSMGAVLAAHIHQLEASDNQLRLDRALLINPPVNMLYAMRTLDQYYETFKSMSLGQLMKLANLIKEFIAIFIPTKPRPPVQPTPEQLQAAIGYSMRLGFEKVVAATQDVNDLRILPNSDEMNRIRAAKRYGFERYIQEFFTKSFKARDQVFNIEEFNSVSSISALDAYLETAHNVYLMHNRDDFLLQSSDIDWLERLFNEKSRIYPYGGHMGNLDNPDNLQAIDNWAAGRGLNDQLP